MPNNDSHQHVVKTTAQWDERAVEYWVVPRGCLCVELTPAGKTKLKVGEGNKYFKQLPYICDHGDLTNYYTKDEVDNLFDNLNRMAIMSTDVYDSADDLPSNDNKLGDVRFVKSSTTADPDLYVWIGDRWIDVNSSDIDPSDFVTKPEFNAVKDKVDEIYPKAHTHVNKDILDGITQADRDKFDDLHNYDDTELRELIARATHVHPNKALLDTITASSLWTIADRTKFDDLHNYDDTEVKVRLVAVEEKAHTHANKTVLDGITQEKLDAIDELAATYVIVTRDIADLKTKSHTHANKDLLDGTTASFTVEQQNELYRLSQISTFIGAGPTWDGIFGYVPVPEAGQQTYYLRADGTWSKVKTGGDKYKAGEGIYILSGEVATDTFPFKVYSKSARLKQYVIYGAIGGVGDQVSLSPRVFNIPITVTSDDYGTRQSIITTADPLYEGDYIDYSRQVFVHTRTNIMSQLRVDPSYTYKIGIYADGTIGYFNPGAYGDMPNVTAPFELDAGAAYEIPAFSTWTNTSVWNSFKNGIHVNMYDANMNRTRTISLSFDNATLITPTTSEKYLRMTCWRDSNMNVTQPAFIQIKDVETPVILQEVILYPNTINTIDVDTTIKPSEIYVEVDDPPDEQSEDPMSEYTGIIYNDGVIDVEQDETDLNTLIFHYRDEVTKSFTIPGGGGSDNYVAGDGIDIERDTSGTTFDIDYIRHPEYFFETQVSCKMPHRSGSQTRIYTKLTNEKTLGAIVTHTVSGFQYPLSGPLFVSTIPTAVGYGTDFDAKTFEAAANTFEYLGYTWYYTDIGTSDGGYYMEYNGTASDMLGNMINLGTIYPDGTSAVSIAKDIIDAAGLITAPYEISAKLGNGLRFDSNGAIETIGGTQYEAGVGIDIQQGVSESYHIVEYLESKLSDRSQAINIGYKKTQNLGMLNIQLKWRLINEPTESVNVVTSHEPGYAPETGCIAIGARKGDSGMSYFAPCALIFTSAGWGGSASFQYDPNNHDATILRTDVCGWDDDGDISINGKDGPYHIDTGAVWKNIFLFDNAPARIYFCRIFDNDTLVRDLVPCVRDSDNIQGFYDRVGKVFYPNPFDQPTSTDYISGPETGEVVYDFTHESESDPYVITNKGIIDAEYDSQNLELTLTKDDSSLTIPVADTVYTAGDNIIITGEREVFTKLEYIQSRGNQNINTHKRIRSGHGKFAADFQFVHQPDSGKNRRHEFIIATEYVGDGMPIGSPIIGMARGGSGGSYGTMAGIATGTGGAFSWYWINSSTTTNRTNVNVEYFPDTKISINGTNYTPDDWPVINDKELYLFGTSDHKCWAKLYSVKIWDDDVLIFDGIPVKRNSDNEVGIFDKCNNEFFINDLGGGALGFDAGPVESGADPVYGNYVGRTKTISAVSYTLPIASDTTLGGIKVGDNLTIDQDGVLSATNSGGTEYVEGRGIEFETDSETYLFAENLYMLSNTPIDTGIIPSGSYDFHVEMQFKRVGTSGFSIICYNGYEGSFSYQPGYGRSWIYDGHESWIDLYGTTAPSNSICTVDLKWGRNMTMQILPDGTYYSKTTSYDPTNVCHVLLNSSGGNESYVYYVKMWDGDTLVGDLVPCVRQSDNATGFFNKVDNTFHTNTSGPAITHGTLTGESYEIISPTSINAKLGDGLSFDSNDAITVDEMVGADGTNDGTSGTVPAPTATDNTKFLRGDATWVEINDTNYAAGQGITFAHPGMTDLGFDFDAFVAKITSMHNGTKTVDSEHEVLTLTATGADCYTEPYSSASAQDVYTFPIIAGHVYRLTWDSSNPSVSGRIFAFENVSETNLHWIDQSVQDYLEFTAVTSGTINFRFGVANSGNTISYSNIHFYEMDDFDPDTTIVNADIAKGLEFDSLDKLQVKLGDGLHFDSNDAIEIDSNLYYPGQGIEFGGETLIPTEFNQSAFINVIGASRGNISKTPALDAFTLTATGDDCFTDHYEGYGGYYITAEPNTKYRVSWESTNGTSGNMFVFEVSGTSYTGVMYIVNNANTNVNIFTTSSTCTKLSLRFGVASTGNSERYSNITFDKVVPLNNVIKAKLGDGLQFDANGAIEAIGSGTQYVRVNTTDSYVLLHTKPADWDDHWDRYFELTYDEITTAPPDWDPTQHYKYENDNYVLGTAGDTFVSTTWYDKHYVGLDPTTAVTFDSDVYYTGELHLIEDGETYDTAFEKVNEAIEHIERLEQEVQYLQDDRVGVRVTNPLSENLEFYNK